MSSTVVYICGCGASCNTYGAYVEHGAGCYFQQLRLPTQCPAALTTTWGAAPARCNLSAVHRGKHRTAMSTVFHDHDGRRQNRPKRVAFTDQGES